MDRHFGVATGGGADQFRVRQETVTTQGCVTSDAGCTLDPLVVVAPPPEPADYPPCPGCEAPFPGTTRPGGGDGGGGGGGGGTASGEAGDYQEQNPEDTRPDCEKEADGYCRIREISGYEWQVLGEVIESLRDDITECRETKNILRGMYAQGPGRFRVWDGKDLNATRTRQRFGFMSSDAGGRIIVYDAYYVAPRRDRGVVVHEGLHVYLNNIGSPLSGEDNESWVRQWESTCER